MRVTNQDLATIRYPVADLPLRAQRLLLTRNVSTLGALAAMEPHELLTQSNVGARTLRAVLERAEVLAAVTPADLMIAVHPCEKNFGSCNSVAGIASRWLFMRDEVKARHTSECPIPTSGLPARARTLIDLHGCQTLGHLMEMDFASLLKKRNVGQTTLRALLRCVEDATLDLPRDEPDGSQSPPTVIATPLSFVEIVDALLQRVNAQTRQTVTLRILQHEKLQNVATVLGLSRERIRQLEGRFLSRLHQACLDADWHGAAALDDGFIEFGELQGSAVGTTLLPQDNYVTLARATLLSARTVRTLEAFYRTELDVLVDDLGDSTPFLAGLLSDIDILRRAAELTPALREWPDAFLISEVRSELGPRAKKGARPRLRALMTALVRQAGGQISVAALRQRVGALVAATGANKIIDDAVIRTVVQRASGLTLRGADTVVVGYAASGEDLSWRDSFINHVLAAGRPVSLATYLGEHPLCPVDEYTLADLLNQDARVERVGRRLYCSAALGAGGPVRVVDILRQALRSVRGPWTHAALLAYVRTRRDLQSSQIDHYFKRMPEVLGYSAHCVGLEPLTRAIMLDLLANEQFVVDRLAEQTSQTDCSVEDLWLDDAGSDDRLTPEEGHRLLSAAASWDSVRILAGDPLRFRRRG